MVIKSQNNYLKMLETTIRNKESSSEDLQQALFDFGYFFGAEIVSCRHLCSNAVCTPMGLQFEGYGMSASNSIIISTKDDYQFFASGLSKSLKSNYTGYMNFNGVRGIATFTEDIREICLPDVNDGIPIDTVYIAKSVIATGCTAITLAKKAVEKYCPRNIVIVSIFYSPKGVSELLFALPNADIYLGGTEDQVDNDGMLIPGLGNIDERIHIH